MTTIQIGHSSDTMTSNAPAEFRRRLPRIHRRKLVHIQSRDVRSRTMTSSWPLPVDVDVDVDDAQLVEQIR